MSLPSRVTGLEGATVVHADGTVALREVTLLAGPGELLAVLGPSGSGKSSMLRAIAGLVELRSGRVLIDGERTVEPTGQRNVAMVFERSQLVPFLDVAKNMSFALDLRHVPGEQSRERVEEQARGLNLTRLLSRKPANLSHGERARVGIGRALVRAPAAFLLDEPLAHIDAGERIRMRHHISDVVRQTGVTTFYVTHDQSEAMSIGDRIAVLNEGTIVQVGPPRQLYDEPVDTFVAAFLGPAPIGFMPARLVVSGGMAGYQVATRTLPTWAPPLAGLDHYRDRAVLIGIRPEDMHEHPRPEHGTITGVVTTLALAGRYALAGIQVGDHRLTARFDGRTTARPGSTVTVGVDAARVHVFDLETGRALAHPSAS